MALGDLYEVTLFQSYREQQMINRWHYEVTTGGSSSATELLETWQDNILPLVAAIQTEDVTYTRLLVQNLVFTTDNAEDLVPTPITGASLAANTPLRLALAYRSSRPDLSRRYSWKRFGGVRGDLLTGSNWNIQVNVLNLAAGMALILTPSANAYAPVQVRANCPGNGMSCTYTRNFFIQTWTALAEPSTQDSRTFGRGS